MNRLKKRAGGVLVAAALLTFTLSSCDFVQPTETNPNSVPDATLDQLFTAIQVSNIFFAENQMNRLSSMWINQMAGTDRQFSTLDLYIYGESVLSGEYSDLYTGGGLIDMRNAIAKAEAEGRTAYAGILKIQEAYRFGTAASIWGAIPYSEAAQPDEFPNPSLDDQAAVYSAVQALLSDAISDLSAGSGGPGSTDFFFGGDTGAWTAVAHSLKARFHLHWAEADPSRYQQALTEAQQGISDPSDNWTTVHSTSSTESNLWNQFFRDRDTYIRTGSGIVDLMKSMDDPRVPLYFAEATGDFAGSYVGSGDGGEGAGQNASKLGVTGQADYGQPIITCAETQFIAAEAALQTGNAAQAKSFLDAGVACQEAYWASLGFDIDIPDPGPATMENIIHQKYIASFLNMEAWNDYKRTCLPEITLAGPNPFGDVAVPRRIYYGQSAREANTGVYPTPDQQQAANANDPNPC